MDYAGQRLAEQLNLYILLIFAIIAFVVGYLTSSFALLMKIYSVGLLLDAALVVPNWPWLNKHPLQWLPPLKEDETKNTQLTSSKKRS